MSTRHHTYFVCATPRTGSSLLLGLLESTGVAGRPQSYFRAPDRPLWARRWGLPDDAGDDAYLEAARAHGRTANGVFGAKLMWDTLPPVRQAHFLYVHRGDVVAQAVSWLRAEQTGTWYLGGHGEISGTAPTGRAPAYDHPRIASLVRTITEHNAAWEAWFVSAGVSPHRLRYEELVADPAAAVHDILHFLGLQLPAGHTIEARHRRQSDDLNQQWADRYRATGT